MDSTHVLTRPLSEWERHSRMNLSSVLEDLSFAEGLELLRAAIVLKARRGLATLPELILAEVIEDALAALNMLLGAPVALAA